MGRSFAATIREKDDDKAVASVKRSPPPTTTNTCREVAGWAGLEHPTEAGAPQGTGYGGVGARALHNTLRRTDVGLSGSTHTAVGRVHGSCMFVSEWKGVSVYEGKGGVAAGDEDTSATLKGGLQGIQQKNMGNRHATHAERGGVTVGDDTWEHGTGA